MTSCTVENWTLEDLATALQDMHKDNKRIAVPMFQRGERWNDQQQRSFIDSLIRGFPVGTMLFFETFESGKQTYILVDGLQRGSSIKKYMNDPTEFFYDKNISDEFCESILQIVSSGKSENYEAVRSILMNFIKNQKTFKGLQYYGPAKEIVNHFNSGDDQIGDLIDVIARFFDDRQALYEQISLTVIPVIVYHGAEENLPEIFDRINSQGTPLDQYEVYAAAWPVNRRFKIENAEIVEFAIKKYDAFAGDGLMVHGYNKEAMRGKKEVNAFEYLFGLGKVLVQKYSILGFQKNLPDDAVNPLGFELVNACLNEKDQIKKLYQNIYAIKNINDFEKALYNAIEFVTDAIATITSFKGNSRTGTKMFHSKYQILSMISTTFKEMYKERNYAVVSGEWGKKKNVIANNLRLYYVYDIITNYWREGVAKKMFSAANPNRYETEISPRAWKTALDVFYENAMSREESKQVPNPKSGEYVFLNSVYLSTFTAMDQLSLQKFDVEHIAPKEQMKKLIAITEGRGLPISCIANLCYLPEMVNRSKRDKNFYQDQKYLQHINLKEVESKYSFTTREDLEWMDMPYDGPEDFEALKQFYVKFCRNRFETMKKVFCNSMGIDYAAMSNDTAERTRLVSKQEGQGPISIEKDIVSSYIEKVEQNIGEKLYKTGRSAYLSADGERGYIVCTSKAYRQGEREKYWFAYREKGLENIKECTDKTIIYICRNAEEAILYPMEAMENIKERLNYSTNGDGSISHWHIVFYKDKSGNITQQLSKPDVEEIDINKYKL